MPKHYKAYRRTNLKRLRQEYYLYKKRSDAAKRGWVTRRLREQGVQDSPDVVIITRLKYKPRKGDRMVYLEIERIGTRITRISVGNRSYTSKDDLQAFNNMLEHAELDD